MYFFLLRYLTYWFTRDNRTHETRANTFLIQKYLTAGSESAYFFRTSLKAGLFKHKYKEAEVQYHQPLLHKCFIIAGNPNTLLILYYYGKKQLTARCNCQLLLHNKPSQNSVSENIYLLTIVCVLSISLHLLGGFSLILLRLTHLATVSQEMIYLECTNSQT